MIICTLLSLSKCLVVYDEQTDMCYAYECVLVVGREGLLVKTQIRASRSPFPHPKDIQIIIYL